jgi:mannose-6-phosphate isomerase-like protein (cupin superfamily)
MAGYTHSNLREDVEDSAPKFGMSDTGEARFASRDLGLQTSGVSLQRLNPDVTQPFGHTHHEQEELYVVLAGSGRAKLGDAIVELRPFDALRVEPDVTRAFSAGPDGLEFLAYGAPTAPDRPQDAEMHQGWWDGGA